jgi:ElaB/YqjD/DUF883 family membrane-anchored ribosome-binding protein
MDKKTIELIKKIDKTLTKKNFRHINIKIVKALISNFISFFMEKNDIEEYKEYRKKIRDLLKFLKGELQENVREYISLCNKYSYAYFLTPPRYSSARRAEERENFLEYENNEFREIVDVYFKFKLQVSVKHYYVTKKAYVNKYTNLTTVKKLQKEINILIELLEEVLKLKRKKTKKNNK